MFQSERCRKSGALLNHEGCDEIKDPHRRAVTAVLLENQENSSESNPHLTRAECLMSKPTMNTNSGANAGFLLALPQLVLLQVSTPVLISLIRRSMPNLVAYDLAGVRQCPVLLDSSSQCAHATTLRLATRHSTTKQTPDSLDPMLDSTTPTVISNRTLVSVLLLT